MKTPNTCHPSIEPRPGVLLTIEPLEERRAPATFIVTTNLDDPSGSISGQTTLRDAIAQSNSTPGANTITFQIGADFGTNTAQQTIDLGAPLPAITNHVSIFGGDQTGTTYSSPGIILNGAGAGAGDGFDVTAGNSTIEGFVIQGFTGHGIMLSSKGSDEIINVSIGTNATLNGVTANTMDGILISNVGSDAIQSCTISGNTQNGIEITGTNAANILIGAGGTIMAANPGTAFGGGNHIGVDVTGTLSVPNQLDGILIHNSANHITMVDNVVSANAGNGIHITGTGASSAVNTGTYGNILTGNFIGTDITGTKVLGNTGDGVLIDGGSTPT